MNAYTAEQVGIGVGDGLAAMTRLLEGIVFPAIGFAGEAEDGTAITLTGLDQVVTTDVFAVDPLEFPGGDIGRLAVSGVVNDLAASGARARYLTVGLLLSAELRRDVLERVLRSLQAEATEVGCAVICGDTKVHQYSQPLLTMTVTAIGTPYSTDRFRLSATRPGDLIGITGALGAHSIAVLSAREGLGFEHVVHSDVNCLLTPFESTASRARLRSLRDLTRGGLVAGLWDGARDTGLRWHVERASIAVDEPVEAACALLGLDPLALTNEGVMLFTAEPQEADTVVALLQEHKTTTGARIIGRVEDSPVGAEVTIALPGGRVDHVVYPEALGVPRLC